MAQVIDFAAASRSAQRAKGVLVFPVLVLPKRSKKAWKASTTRDVVRQSAKARL